MPLRLPRPLYDRIVKEARRAHPRECCGLVSGVEGRVEALHPLPNASEEPLGFRADAAAQRAALAEISRAGLEWIGTYHSHAFDVAAPSGADIDAASRPAAGGDRVHLVVSFMNPTRPRLAAYRIHRGRDVSEEVIVE